MKEFTLKHNVYPYRIEYSYKTISSQFIDIAYWQPVVATAIPTHNASLKVSIPDDVKAKFFIRDIENYRHTSEKNVTTHSWSSEYLKPFRNEVFSPPLLELVPLVRITPENFRYEIPGNSASWKDFGNWVHTLNEGAYYLRLPYSLKILSMIEKDESTFDKVNTLYRYLQATTRYVNVSIGTGGLKSYPASYVAHNRYGDCKALSVYMKAILEVAGIPSYLTLIYAGDNPVSINHDFPSSQFNHVILMVPLENDTLWLECTGKGPAGYLGSFTQGRDALVIKNNRTFWAKTPALSREEVLQDRFISIQLRSGLSAEASIRINNKGDSYDLFHSLQSNYNKNEIDRIIKENFSLPDFAINEFHIEETDPDKPEILLTLKANSGNHIRRLGNNVMVKPIPFHIPFFESPATRTLPVRINYPVYQSDTLVYHLNRNNLDISSFQPVSWESEYGTFEISYQKTEDGFMVSKIFMLHAGEYSLEKYPEFFEFIQKVRNFQNTNSLLFN